MKYLLPLFFALVTFQTSFAQLHEYLPNDRSERLWYENQLLNTEGGYHTAVRPYRRSWLDTAVAPKDSLQKPYLNNSDFGQTWLGNNVFNKNLIQLSGKNYALTANPIFETVIGNDSQSELNRTYINSRGVWIEGRLGKIVTFRTTLIETQARFEQYYNEHIDDNGYINGWAAGLVKTFKGSGYDYARASGEISITPSEIFNVSLGHGNHFFGDGYRSMLLSDNTIAYPYLRLETTFGPIKYINMWSQMNDPRDSLSIGGVYAKKYLSLHYLSINLTKRWNLGLYEAIMWGDELNRYGFDVNFFNPIIFYRSVEYNTGFEGGNVLVGLSSSYQFKKGIKAYGQLMIDEFTKEAVFSWSGGSWLNMFAYQIGTKWGNALGINNLFLRAEYNVARPYTYAHREPITNYGHFNMPLAHPWGSNFKEFLFHANYRIKRWWFDARFHLGVKGLNDDTLNYGGDIRYSWNDRAVDEGVYVGQGIQSNISYTDFSIAYLINPNYNLRLQAGVRLRTATTSNEDKYSPTNAANIYFGLKTWLFNRYQDL